VTNKRILQIVGVLVVLTMLVAACSCPQQPTVEPTEEMMVEPTEETMAEPTEETMVEPTEEMTEPEMEQVTITWWHISTAEDFAAAWQAMADEFMAAHPNVTIEITILENEAFKSKLPTVMQSGDPPDLFQSWGGGVMNEFAKEGLLRDITPEMDMGWRDTFGAGPLGVYAYEGRQYGVPWDMGMVGFWYNKALFADAGIDAPPTTWAEFLDDVQLLEDSGTIPIALGEGEKWPGHYYWVYLATRICGKAGFDAAYNRTAGFDAACYVQAGEELQKLIDLEPFQDGYLGAGYGDQAGLVGNGEAAMELMGQWAPSVEMGNSESGEGLGDDLGFFTFPAVEGGAGNVNDAMGGGNGFAVGVNAPDEAVEFLQFLTSVENQKTLTEMGVIVPVVKGAEEAIADPNMKMVYDALSRAEYFQLYYDQYLPPAVGEAVNDSVQELFAGTMTPVEVAQAIEEAASFELD
jgi:raffinose/stachyose/melibiose transport system substrate-binding protein